MIIHWGNHEVPIDESDLPRHLGRMVLDQSDKELALVEKIQAAVDGSDYASIMTAMIWFLAMLTYNAAEPDGAINSMVASMLHSARTHIRRAEAIEKLKE